MQYWSTLATHESLSLRVLHLVPPRELLLLEDLHREDLPGLLQLHLHHLWCNAT